ncbi:hypothetical protein IWW38_003351, partial [Coemansia aciculifera]
MNIATPNNGGGGGGGSDAAGPRILHDTDPILVNLDVAVDSAPEELRAGLEEIVRNHTVPYFRRADLGSEAQNTWLVGFERSDDIADGSYEARTVASGDETQPRVLIRYRRAVDAFRALGQVLTAARAAELAADGGLLRPDFVITEKAQFETLALMIDCSRNGVLGVKSVCAMLRSMALMGFNMLQLYTEDT